MDHSSEFIETDEAEHFNFVTDWFRQNGGIDQVQDMLATVLYKDGYRAKNEEDKKALAGLVADLEVFLLHRLAQIENRSFEHESPEQIQ